MEQRCIICGNVVKFERGEKVATCEYCETRQEYIGDSDRNNQEANNGFISSQDTALKRARQMPAGEPVEIKKEEFAHHGAVPGSGSAVRFTPPDTPVAPRPPVYPAPPKRSSAGKIVGIVLGATLFTIIMLVVLISGLKKHVPSAGVTVSELEVGQYVSDIVVTADDPSMYTATVSEVYYYGDSGNVYLNDYDTIDEERTYYVVVEFIPEGRYKFDSTTSYYINGEYASTYSEDKDTIKEIAMNAVDNTKETVQISSSWSSDKQSVNGYDVSSKKLSKTAEDCLEFTVNFRISECTEGSANGNWCIYIREAGGSFYKVNTFYYSGNSNAEYTTYFETPTDFDEIAVVPEYTKTLSWSYSIYPRDFVVKKQ